MLLKCYLSVILTLNVIYTSLCNLAQTGQLIDPNRNQSLQTFISTHMQSTHFVGTYQQINMTSNLPEYMLGIYFLSPTPPIILTLPTNITSQYHLIRTYSENTYIISSNNNIKFQGTLLLIENQQSIKIGINQIENYYEIYNCKYHLSQTIKRINKQLFTNLTQQIIDGMFGYNNQQLIILLKSQIGYVVKYIFFNFTSNKVPYIRYTSDYLLDDSIVNVTNNQTYLNKMQYDYYSNVVYLPFTKIIIGVYANFTLNSKGYYYYGDVRDVSFSVDAKTQNQIAISYENTIIILDSSKKDALTGNWKLNYNITSQNYIESIKFAPYYNFLYINAVHQNSKMISQIKYNMNYNSSSKQYSGQILGSVQYNSPFKSSLQVINNHKIFLFDANPQMSNYRSNMNNLFFQYDFILTCQNCTQCPNGFLFNVNESTCEFVIPYGSGGTAKSRNTPSYNFGYTNKTSPIAVLPIQSVKQYSLILQKLNESSSFSKFCNYFSKSITFVSMKITPQAFLSLVTLLDDLWYYKYHNTNYPQQAKFFMEKVDLINQLRFMIKKKTTDIQHSNTQYDEVQLFYGIFNSYQSTKNSNWPTIYISNRFNIKYVDYLQMQTNLTNNTNFPDQIYFINSTSDIYINTLFLNIVLFVILKIVHVILSFVSKLCKKVEWLHRKVQIQSKWWTLIVAIIQPNIMRLTYYAFLQMSTPFSFVFQNKIVLAITILTLYIIIFYTLNFYCLTYTFELPLTKSYQPYEYNINRVLPTQNIIHKISMQHQQHTKNPSHILLTCTVEKSNSINPYIFQTCCILVRKITRSFINSYFITNYTLQITLLFSTDLFVVFYIFFNKKLFNNFLLFFLILIYHFTFAIFDGFFMFQQYRSKNIALTNQFQNKFAFITLSILTVTSLLVCLLLFSFIIKKCFIFIFQCCKKNNLKQQSQNQEILNFNEHYPIDQLIKQNKTDNSILQKKSKDIQLIDSFHNAQTHKVIIQSKSVNKINLKYKRYNNPKQEIKKQTLFIKSKQEQISFEEQS